MGIYSVYNCEQTLNRARAKEYTQEEIKIGIGYLKIGVNAFKKNIKIKGVTLPDTIYEIERGAFSGCSSLQYILIPKSTEVIGESAFRDCKKLREITLPDNLEIVEENLFRGCNNLSKVNVSKKSNIVVVEKDAFNGCFNLDGVIIPNSIKKIKFRAFYRTKALKKLRLPDSLEYIGKEAFYFSGIDELIVPRRLKIIDDFAFKNCKFIEEVSIPKSVKKIGDGAFSGCRRLNILEIGHELGYIGEGFVNKNTTVLCKKGSNIDIYCQENGISHEYI